MARINPNQKNVTVHKTEIKKEKGFVQFDRTAYNKARVELNTSAFLLWLYMAENQDGYEFGLSNVAFKNACGLGKTAYDNAVKELVDKGYLVLRKGKTTYDFYDIPTTVKADSVVMSQNNETANEGRCNVTIQQKVSSQYNKKLCDNTTDCIVTIQEITQDNINNINNIDGPTAALEETKQEEKRGEEEEIPTFEELKKQLKITSQVGLHQLPNKQEVEEGIWEVVIKGVKYKVRQPHGLNPIK